MINKLNAANVALEIVTLGRAVEGFKGADSEKAEQALFDFFEKHLKK